MDYDKAKSLIDPISQVERKYLLHGDTGVHNFVFQESAIAAFIDPSSMVSA